MKNYYVYILTNPDKEVLYTGVTNNLARRVTEHFFNRGNPKTFAGRYYCYELIYWEDFKDIRKAIAREKEIKGWRRAKKLALIAKENPTWKFYNSSIMDHWPPIILNID
jgi:putative endonuclease